ncbi:MAG: cobalt transporter ATP-binding protein, partial [Thermoleophilia bacterium]|nr:cobalt transporter ATP-binding protein [Thermoleophilia bacterium]
MPELDARGLIVSRPGAGRDAAVPALGGVDLRVGPGELVAVMGPTGAGKSTLALALAGLLPLDAGHVAGDSVGQVRVVLQRPESSFLGETVLEDVALAARWRGEPKAVAERHAAALLVSLGLPAEMAARDPLTLSGGEARRAAIAAVLAAGARTTILDEPAAGLDPVAREELHRALRALHAAGRTLIVITHDPAEAAELATRLVVLREGAVAWDGPVAAVLGDPARARSLGLEAAPEVQLLEEVARGRGAPMPPTNGRPADAVDALATLLAAPRSTAAPPRSGPHDGAQAAPIAHRPPLPPLVDARVRLLAAVLVVLAALLANSVLAAGAVAVAAAIAVAAAGVERRRVLLVVRPLLALGATLLLLGVLLGGTSTVALWRGHEVDARGLAAVLRALQATGVTLATLALSGGTATIDLADAMRRLLGPLRVLRVPVDAGAFVVATGLGLVPAFADELDRLRLAQRARGIAPKGAGPVARLRADALLLSPLFVAAFRRAHLLADAL